MYKKRYKIGRFSIFFSGIKRHTRQPILDMCESLKSALFNLFLSAKLTAYLRHMLSGVGESVIQGFHDQNTLIEQLEYLYACNPPGDSALVDYIAPYLEDVFRRRLEEEGKMMVIRHGFEELQSFLERVAERFEEDAKNKGKGWPEYLLIVNDAEQEFREIWLRELYQRERDVVLSSLRERASEQVEDFLQQLGTLQPAMKDGIVWNGTREQLAYLLHLLRTSGLLGNNNLWALAERVFIMHDGSRISRESMKSIAAKRGYAEGGGPSTRAREVERIVRSLFDRET